MFFNEKVNSVYHPLIGSLVPIVVMKCESQDCCSIKLYSNNRNEVLRKASQKKKSLFNLRGCITDMVGQNMEGLRRSVGPHALEEAKTLVFSKTVGTGRLGRRRSKTF